MNFWHFLFQPRLSYYRKSTGGWPRPGGGGTCRHRPDRRHRL